MDNLQRLIDALKKRTQSTVSNVKNTLKPAVHSPIPQYNTQPTYNRPLNQARIAVMKPLAKAQQVMNSPRPTRVIPDIKPFGNKTIAGKVANTVTSIGSNIANDFIRQPIDIGLDTGKVIAGGVRGKLPAYTQLKSAPYRLAYNAKGIQKTPQQVIGNVAGTAAIPLTYMLPKGIANAGRQAMQTGIKQPLLRAAGQGARTGAIDAGLYGTAEGLSENRDKTLVQQFLKAGSQGAQSAAVGALFGGTVSGVGSAAGRVRDIIAGKYQQLNPKISVEEAQKQASKFIRDELGRFAKSGSKKNKPEPMFYGELRESLGLPRTGEYNKGFIDVEELAGNKKNFTPLTQDMKNQGIRSQLPKIMYEDGKSPKSVGEVFKSTDDYVRDLVGRQKEAKGTSGPSGIIQKGKSFLSEIKEKFVDTASPIEDAVNIAEKQGKFKVLPKEDVRLQIDRVLRSKTLASQFAEDNGMSEVIKNVPDLDYLDQYMIAKQARDVSEFGFETGRNKVQDERLIQELGPQYEQYAKKVNEYSRKLLNYSVETGLIDKDLAAELIKKYPNYVPLNKVFSEMEKGTLPKVGTRGVANLSKQSVVQKLKGKAEDDITASPMESLLLKTQDAFNQGERNKAARMLAQMKDIPFFKDLIRELPEGQDAAHKFTYLDNGTKRSFETTKEIADAAKSLTQENLGLIGKIASVPTRVLQMGATGLNIPFVITNVVKDQMTTFINSNKAAKTSLLNPLNFGRAFFAAIGHDDLYKEVVRQGAGGTSFDIARNAPDLSIQRIRAGKNIGSKIKYSVTHPQELFRALEDIIGRGEEITRIQNYKGTKEALLKEGRTAQDASLLGAKAARDTTANFGRKGSWGRVLNGVIPFFNAGIQGARQLDRSFQNDPAGTVAKVTIGLFTPMAMATTWNLSDPKRKEIYEDINDFEKENNIILIPDNVTQDEQGRYNVIKIPIPPGLSNLTTLVRRPMEQASGLDPVKFSEIATNLFAAGTSLDITSSNKLASTFTPQALKPSLETYTNTNLFTGNKIVPDSMRNLPPNLQTKTSTPPLANAIGGALNMSPLYVENAAQTMGGGVGNMLIGKEDPATNLQKRFSKASGGKQTNIQYEKLDKLREEDAIEKYNLLKKDVPKEELTIYDQQVRRKRNEDNIYEGLKHNDYSFIDKNSPRESASAIFRLLENTPKEERGAIYQTVQEYITPEMMEQLNAIADLEKEGLTASDRDIALLPKEIRARKIYERLNGLTDVKNRRKKYELYKKVGVLSPDVELVLKRLVELGE